ncbi:hypothetical protein ACGFRG_25530 [Streptomyces sp. NPDC048696]|uniref:hypothetical protein n=1 Tax=Streptomyces sp. NPDC048696 TaxID=3365585 RepID=UPI00371DD6CD
MHRDDVAHLDRLARRVDGPGPVTVLDPLARNLLAADQAAGLGPAGGKWSVTGSEIILYGGGLSPYVPNTVSVETVPAVGYTNLQWRHPTFHGIPVVAGQTYTWWAPGLVASGAVMMSARVAWYDASRTYLSTSAAPAAGVPLVAAAPVNAAYVQPYVAFTAKGVWELGPSVFAAGDIAAALLAGELPPGEGTPPFSITRYSHVATDGDGAYRDIGLELVEVVTA